MKEKHPTENRRYVVVIRRGANDYEPTHPGSTDRASANRLMTILGLKGLTTELWTHDKWNRYDDEIRADVFCPECGEERVFCNCQAKEG